jgi:hypothetical protein|eukprot:COSAG01_NODE_3255_length_6346_cov_14.579638_6_plen_54_part_00
MAHPTVYLNNLSFTNTFANVDRDLYDNADLELTVSELNTDANAINTFSFTAGA